MAVSGVSGSGATDVPTVSADKIGFAGMTSETFLKLLITQLQNQDPTEPVGNEELLQQLSTMRNLQANIELSDALKQITSDQQITAGSSILGTIVTGTNAAGTEVTGLADRVFVRDGATVIGMGDEEIPLKSVTGVSLGL